MPCAWPSTRLVFATASEDTRPVLTGVCAEFEEDTLTMAAADGFRLAVHKAPLISPAKEKVEIIIPGRCLSELNRLLADQKEPVEIAVSQNKSQVLFRMKDWNWFHSSYRVPSLTSGNSYRASYSTRAVIGTPSFSGRRNGGHIRQGRQRYRAPSDNARRGIRQDERVGAVGADWDNVGRSMPRWKGDGEDCLQR